MFDLKPNFAQHIHPDVETEKRTFVQLVSTKLRLPLARQGPAKALISFTDQSRAISLKI